MFSNFSLTWTSGIVLALTYVFKLAGVDVSNDALTSFVVTGIQVVSVVGILWGRYRHGDINVFGKKVSRG